MRGPGMLIGAMLAALLTAPAAAAAPAWLPAVQVSAPGVGALQSDVAVDRDGRALAVWARGDVIQFATRAPGAPFFGPATDLSSSSSAPRLALDGSGGLTAMWIRAASGTSFVQARVRPPGEAAFTPAQDLTPVDQFASDLELIAEPGGAATAIWSRNQVVEAAQRPAGATAFAPAQELAPATSAPHTPRLAVDALGNLTAVWVQRVNTPSGLTDTVQTASRPAGAPAFGPVQDLSLPGVHARAPRIALDAVGRATAIWSRGVGTNAIVQVATRPSAGEPFGPPQDLTSPGAQSAVPMLVVDPDGIGTTAFWMTYSDSDTAIIRTASRAAGATSFGPAQDISPPIDNGGLAGATALPGVGTLALWGGTIDGATRLQSRLRPTSSADFDPVLEVPDAKGAALLEVATDPEGNATAIWGAYDVPSANYHVASAVLDAAGPAIDGLTIPASGLVGQTLSFAVAPRDRWSGTGPTTWSFGDGQSASGLNPTHAYAAPGAYTVTVTVTDGLGNATSRTATVTIPAPPSPPVLRDTVAPTLSALTLTPTRFRAASRGAGLATVSATTRPVGTRLRFRADEASTLRLTVSRLDRGRRAGGRCVRPTRTNRRGRACTRVTRLPGTLTARANTGVNVRRFTGRLAGRRLRPARYRLTATLRDSAGNVGRARAAAFTVVRR